MNRPSLVAEEPIFRERDHARISVGEIERKKLKKERNAVYLGGR